MSLKPFAHGIKNLVEHVRFTVQRQGKPAFECPVCGYTGPFMDVAQPTGRRKHARCPRCRALERHRLQFLVLERVLAPLDTGGTRMLHFAPEPLFQPYFIKRFGRYESADLEMRNVDHNVDIQRLPFGDGVYGFVFASHVLEHIPDDNKALSEIRRILKPGGIAMLPVPVVAQRTIEYPEPNPREKFHVRAPGLDYFDRYQAHFSKVERFTSESFPGKYQLFIQEDRSKWPTPDSPLRLPMPGTRHIEVVPVCHA